MTAIAPLVDRIPDILANADLVTLVTRYTAQPGKPDGTRLRWACPHPGHADADPSFVVYPRKRPPDFYCYGCGWGGDAITFLIGVENLTKAAALEWLAAHVGLNTDLPTPNREKPRGARPSCSRYTVADFDIFVDACHRALGCPVVDHDAALRILLEAFPDARVLDYPQPPRERQVRRAPVHTERVTESAAWAYLRQRGVTAAEVAWYRIGCGVSGHPRFGTLRNRLILPCPYGIEARLIPGHTQGVWEPEQRYVVPAGDPKRAWGIDRIDPARGPLILVEGVFDAIALERAGVQAVALRGKRLRPDDAAAIRRAGFDTVLVGLDNKPDVAAADVQGLIRALASAGVGAQVVRGLAEGDWGDLLRLPDHQLARAVATGVTTL